MRVTIITSEASIDFILGVTCITFNWFKCIYPVTSEANAYAYGW